MCGKWDQLLEQVFLSRAGDQGEVTPLGEDKGAVRGSQPCGKKRMNTNKIRLNDNNTAASKEKAEREELQ
jgi:hypothetical protein